MLIGIVLLSAAVGLVTMGAAFVLALPTWVAVASYPAIGSLALLFCAVLRSTRTDMVRAGEGLQRQASHG